MHVKKNIPTPVPTSFDLLGLTEGEVRTIRVALGALDGEAAKRCGEDGSREASRLCVELRTKTGVTYNYNGHMRF